MERKPIKLVPTAKKMEKMTVAEISAIKRAIGVESEKRSVALKRAKAAYEETWRLGMELEMRLNVALRGPIGKAK